MSQELSPLKQNKIVPITSLHPHPRNYRNHTEKQIANLIASLERFGQGRSIVEYKLASGADLCYNKNINIDAPAMMQTPRSRTNLLRRFVMDNYTTFIYALIDPNTQQIRYIGKSDNPQKRLYRHLREKGNSYKVKWMQSLKAKEQVPEIQIIEEVLVSEWQEREMYWIAYCKEQGLDIANGTDGGEGVHGRKRTPEEKARISASLIGNQRSKGYKLTPEQKDRQKAALIGHSVKPDTGEKIAASKRGKSRSVETNMKVSASLKGRKLSESHIAKLQGRKHSAETNAKRSASLKKALSTPEARKIKSQAAKKWRASQRENRNGA